MVSFRQIEDIPKARLPTHLAQFIERLLANISATHQNYDPENDGHIILVTPRDTDAALCEKIGRRWAESMIEGVSHNLTFRCYHAIILRNNQFALSIIIPDDPWLDPAIRARLLTEIGP